MAKPTNLTAPEFNEFIQKNDFAVIDCWSPTCGPCLMLAPVIDELASKHANVAFAKLNVSDRENIPVASKFGVQVIPTLLVFKNGEFTKRYVGYHSAEQLEEELGL